MHLDLQLLTVSLSILSFLLFFLLLAVLPCFGFSFNIDRREVRFVRWPSDRSYVRTHVRILSTGVSEVG